MTRHSTKTILLLQGPTWIFFRDLYNELEAAGLQVLRINLGPADWIHWLGKKGTNFRGRIQQWPAYLESFINRHGVTDIVFYQDSLPYHKIAVDIAHKLGINAYACECGYLRPDWITFEKCDKYRSTPDITQDPDEMLKQAQHLPAIEQQPRYPHQFYQIASHEVSFDLINCLLFFLFPFFSQDRYYHPFTQYLSILPRLFKGGALRKHANQVINELADNHEPYYIFTLQMQSDYQIRDNCNFNHIAEAIELCLRSFADHAPSTDKLVFKIHPYDYGLENWHKAINKLARDYNVAERIHIIDGGNLAKLITHAKGLVNINSTCGIRSLRHGCPTKVLGNAVYDIPGLTAQCSLDEFWQNPETPSKQLFRAFEKMLAATTQIRGTYHTRIGRKVLAKKVAWRIKANRVNDLVTNHNT